MQLRSLSFAGYRSFAARSPAAPDRALENLRLAPITILLGKNNSGKSTVARLLHHVLLALGADGHDPFPMNSGELSFGATFRDVQHGENFFSPLDLKITLGSDDGRQAELDVQLIQLGELADDSPPVVERCEFEGEDVDTTKILSRGLLPDVEAAKIWRTEARELLESSCHVAPVRDAVKSSYSVRETLI